MGDVIEGGGSLEPLLEGCEVCGKPVEYTGGVDVDGVELRCCPECTGLLRVELTRPPEKQPDPPLPSWAYPNVVTVPILCAYAAAGAYAAGFPGLFAGAVAWMGSLGLALRFWERKRKQRNELVAETARVVATNWKIYNEYTMRFKADRGEQVARIMTHPYLGPQYDRLRADGHNPEEAIDLLRVQPAMEPPLCSGCDYRKPGPCTCPACPDCGHPWRAHPHPGGAGCAGRAVGSAHSGPGMTSWFGDHGNGWCACEVVNTMQERAPLPLPPPDPALKDTIEK